MTTLDFKGRAAKALHDPQLTGALARAKGHFALGRAAAKARTPDFEMLRDRATAIRRRSIALMPDLLERFEARATAAGATVHWAADAADARAIATGICKAHGATRAIKSKSMATEEIELNAHLLSHGITPVETDLGEYIIQLRGETPSHIIAPAVHLTKDQVAETFRAAHTDLDPARDISERQALVKEARVKLREAFLAADVGITGANILVAETGTIVLVSNEGNIDLTASAPRLHIAIAGIEKVVESWDDAGIVLRVLARSATGQDMSSYVTVLTGPAQGDEVGPRTSHIILLDNGRSTLAAGNKAEMLACIRCGACLNHCPVYTAVGGHAYGGPYSGPMGAVLTPAIDGLTKDTANLPNASSFCGRCEAVCPVRIPLPMLLRHWREDAYAAGLPTRGERWGLGIWRALSTRPWAYRLTQWSAARGLRFVSWWQGGRIKRLPFAGRGFTATRDIAPPAAKSFQAQWRGRR
ncbi:Lactate utilization protein B [Alphaproteobacteria bacterium SO-S41]|nr:Lactate utilization protein B [Alphaproteobacteria bacterium SO-S41]